MKISKIIKKLQDLQSKKGDINMEAINRHGDSGEPIISSEFRWVSGDSEGKDVHLITSEDRPDED